MKSIWSSVILLIVLIFTFAGTVSAQGQKNDVPSTRDASFTPDLDSIMHTGDGTQRIRAPEDNGVMIDGERRMYQAEDMQDFEYINAIFSLGYQPQFEYYKNERYDLPARFRRDENYTFHPNTILLTPSLYQGHAPDPLLVLAGFTHKRELFAEGVYILSARLALMPGTPVPSDPNEIILRIVIGMHAVPGDASHPDSLVYDIKAREFQDGGAFDVWGEGALPYMPVEMFLGYFKVTLDSTCLDPPSCHSIYGYRIKPVSYADMAAQPHNGGRLTRMYWHDNDPVTPEPDSADFRIKVYYFGAGNVLLDQVNLSDEAGYALFVGDEHCLPEHRKPAPGSRTPLDSLLQERLDTYPVTPDTTVQLLQLQEPAFETGRNAVQSFVAYRIKRKYGSFLPTAIIPGDHR